MNSIFERVSLSTANASENVWRMQLKSSKYHKDSRNVIWELCQNVNQLRPFSATDVACKYKISNNSVGKSGTVIKIPNSMGRYENVDRHALISNPYKFQT